MRRNVLISAVMASVVFGAVSTAHAKCTRLGFSVNDYGKEGPTRDAKKLLDGYIKKWTSANGVTKYRVGKKSVSCKLYLDLILFDEHTCRAEADVCWRGK